MARNKYKKVKYNGTFACGHEGSIYVGGYTDEYRDDEAENRFAGKCPECFKIDKLEKASEMEEELSLPELNGSQAQVEWARQIRLDALKKGKEYYMERFKLYYQKEENLSRFEVAMDRVLYNDSASFWIDNRRESFYQLMKDEFDKGIDLELEERDVELDQQREAKLIADQTVYPEDYDGFNTRIQVEGNKIVVYAEKNDDFRQTVKDLGYRWGNKRWYRNIGPRSGSLSDRVAELGNHLLNLGFAVRFAIDDYEEVKKLAVDGLYEPEHGRWILLSKEGDCFEVTWLGYDPDLYSKVRLLPRSRYNRDTARVEVGLKFFDEVADLADAYDFRLTEEAQAAVDRLRDAAENRLEVAEPKTVEYTDKLVDILDSPAEVLEDLLDD